MNRRNWILLIALVVQAGLVAWLYWPRPAQTAAGPLLPDLAAAQVTGVTVEDNTNRVELAQQEGQWALASGGDFPANSLSVTSFISAVLAVDTGRLVATAPASHVRLRVSDADFVRRVTLATANGEQVVYIGTSPNAGTVHVRAGGSDNVYLTDGALAGAARTDLAGWIDTTYVSLDPASVQQVTVTNANGALELVRGEDGEWTLTGLAPGETLDATALQTLASRVASISLTAPLGTTEQPGFGMDTPAAVVSAVISDTAAAPRTVTLTLGAQDAANSSYVAKSSASDYFVRVAGFQVQEFVDAARGQFITSTADAPVSPLPAP